MELDYNKQKIDLENISDFKKKYEKEKNKNDLLEREKVEQNNKIQDNEDKIQKLNEQIKLYQEEKIRKKNGNEFIIFDII